VPIGIRTVRKIVRQEDYPRDPVGKVTAVNEDGTYAVLLESGLTVNLAGSSSDPIYEGTVVALVRRTRRGTLEIVGRSGRKWVEPTVFYG
jgi:hypothetical protein